MVSRAKRNGRLIDGKGKGKREHFSEELTEPMIAGFLDTMHVRSVIEIEKPEKSRFQRSEAISSGSCQENRISTCWAINGSEVK